MIATIPLGRVGGVPVRVGGSWLLVAPLVGVALFAGIDGTLGSLPARLSVAAVGTVGLFGSVLVHEAGHALVAKRAGVEVRGVVLFLLGGYTEMAVDATRPGQEAMVSVAGPLVSGVFAVALWVLAWFVPVAAGFAQVCRLLAVVNAAVAAFNLLPGFPLDGGRITRSLLVLSGVGDRAAQRLTAWLGIAIGSFLVAVGIAGNARGRSESLVAIPVGAILGVLAWAARPPIGATEARRPVDR